MNMGKTPRPKLMDTQTIWDRHALDAASEDLPQELAVPSYSPRPTTAAGENQRTQIHVPPPTKEQIAAVLLKMDMERMASPLRG